MREANENAAKEAEKAAYYLNSGSVDGKIIKVSFVLVKKKDKGIYLLKIFQRLTSFI